MLVRTIGQNARESNANRVNVRLGDAHAGILVAPAAADDLARMIATHSLPTDAPARVSRSIEPLGRFPRLGAGTDIVSILTIQDGRASAAATAQ